MASGAVAEGKVEKGGGGCSGDYWGESRGGEKSQA